MTYTIGEVAKKTNLSIYTLRYYEKEGLLPFVDRNKSGIRSFKDSDFEWLHIIGCLKASGMPLKDIRTFIEWCMQGDQTLKQRYEMFQERKATVEKQLQELQQVLNTIDYKCWYYQTAVDAGTEEIHKKGKA